MQRTEAVEQSHWAAMAAMAATAGQPSDPMSDQYMRAELHLLKLTPDTDSEIGARHLKWVQRLHDYEHFTTVHRRRPRENTRAKITLPARERRMGEWARYQRRNRQLLCAYQVARLDQSHAFAWDPQSADWQAALEECRRYVDAIGRLPYLNSADKAEFAAARWLARQLRQLQDGTLLPDRAEELQALLQSSNVRWK